MQTDTERALLVADSQARYERIEIIEDHLRFASEEKDKPGFYIAAHPLSVERSYFEITIVETGQKGAIGIGLVPYSYPLDSLSGLKENSVGYRANFGKLHEGSSIGRKIGPICKNGDRLGCGINYNYAPQAEHDVQIVFTRNDCEICSVTLLNTKDPLHPAVSMQSNGEEVRLDLSAEWPIDQNTSYFNTLHILKESDWNGQLSDAIDHNDVHTVNQLLNELAPAHTEETETHKALHIAAGRNLKQCVDFLLQNGADANLSDTHGWLPLHYAAKTGSIGCLESLLHFTRDINAGDKEEWTALLFAANVASLECVEYILNHGGDVHGRNKEGETPLHRAALKGSLECVDILIRNGCNIESSDIENRTPLHYAAQSGSSACLEYLIQHGAQVNAGNNDGWIPLHQAVNYGNIECVKLLLEHGADVNSRTNKGHTALHIAAEIGSITCLETLISFGADVHLRTNEGVTALYDAAQHNFIDGVRKLIESGADVNSRRDNGCTALHCVAQGGLIKCMETLLASGANVNSSCELGNTPLMQAVNYGNVDCTKALLASGANCKAKNNADATVFHFATVKDSLDILKLLLIKEADLHAICSAGWNLLHNAAYYDAKDTLDYLLREPFGIDARTLNGSTALHTAAQHGSMACIKRLIQAGADVNARNNRNMTPSQTAAEEKHFDCYKYLVAEESRSSLEFSTSMAGTTSAVGKIGQQTYTIIHHLDSVHFSLEDVEAMIDDSKCSSEIKHGSFGTAVTVRKQEKWRSEVVVKKIQVNVDELTEEDKKDLCGRRLVHPFILPLIVAFQTNKDESPKHSYQTFYFISPFCANGDLRTIIAQSKDFNQVRRIRTALHVASAIVYLHTSVPGKSYVFLHKHISSANIVLDASWNARLIDFGHAIHSEDEKEHAFYSYKRGGQPCKEWDYFAFGVVVRELLTGRHPEGFGGKYLKDLNKKDIINNIQKTVFQKVKKIQPFIRIADICIETSKGLNFKKAVKHELKQMILLESQLEILSRNQVKGQNKCDICMINPAAHFGADIEQRDPHEECCSQPIRVCVSCYQNSFRNPVKCFSCRSNIGPHWGALLIAGEDKADNETAHAFIEDIREIQRVIPSVFGIKKLNIEVIISEECTDPISEVKGAIKRIEEQEIRTLLVYYSGHGATGNDKPDQANSFKFGSKLMSLEEFQCELGKLSKVETFVIILDRCCAPEVRIEKKSVLQINSCQQDQSSYTVKEGSLFTKYFVQALQMSSENSKCLLPDCDVCKDYRKKSSIDQNFISVDFLYRYIRDHMRKSQSFFRQTPTLFLRGETTRLQIFTIKQIIDFRARNMNEFNIRAGQLGLHLTGRTTLNEDGGKEQRAKKAEDAFLQTLLKDKIEKNSSTSVPAEFLQDPYALNLYEKAIKDGIEYDRSIRINVVGNYGQGKTTLIRRLLDHDISGVESTNGIDVQQLTCMRSPEGKLTYKQETKKDDDILNRLLAVRIADQEPPNASSKSDIQRLKQDKTEKTVAKDNSQPGFIGIDQKDIKHEESLPNNPVRQTMVQTKDLTTSVKYPKPDTRIQMKVLPTKHKQYFEKEAKKMEKEDRKQNDTLLKFWDFGGQLIFYATHSLFHSRQAIYLLVFDLSLQFSQFVTEEDCLIESGKRCVDYYLRFWINSIHSFVGTEDGKDPVVILVGTHKDKIPAQSSERKKYIKKYFHNIRELFDDTRVLNHIYKKDFSIDNNDANDPELFALQEAIQAIGEERSRSIEIPAKWIQLEKALDNIKDRKIVTIQAVFDMNDRTEFPIRDSEQIKLFLRYHHSKGALFFFDESPLSNYVILDPQFLIDAFKCIITSERVYNNDPEVRPMRRLLHTEARLEDSLIEYEWKSEKMFLENKTILLGFLEKHRIITQAREFDETKQESTGLGWYIVTSLLKDHQHFREELQCFLNGKPRTRLQFVMEFKVSLIVELVFHRLIAAVAGKWPIAKHVVSERPKAMIYRNACVVLINDHAGIMEHNGDSIRLAVVSCCPSVPVQSFEADLFRRFCEYVVQQEFRKLKTSDESQAKPYTLRFACNHEDHEGRGSKYYIEENANKTARCPDLLAHDISVDNAKIEWYIMDKFTSIRLNLDLNEKMLSKLSLCIGENWELLGKQLGLTTVKIDHLKTGISATRMKIYNMLLIWNKSSSVTKTLKNLVEAMTKIPQLRVDWDGIRNVADGQMETSICGQSVQGTKVDISENRQKIGPSDDDKYKWQMLEKIIEQCEAEPDLKRIMEDDREFARVYLDLKAGGRNQFELNIDWLEKLKVCLEYIKQEGSIMEVEEMEKELQQNQKMTRQSKKTEKDWKYCISEGDLIGILKLLQKNSFPSQDQLNKICKLVGRKHPLTKIMCSRFCEYIKNTFPRFANSFIWPAYEIKDIEDTSEKINVCFVINDDSPEMFDFQNINVKIVRRDIKSPNKENEDVVEYELDNDVELDCKVLDEMETTINKNVMSLKQKHMNLIMISASPIKSSGYQTGNHHMKPTNCIVLFVPVKGLTPLEEDIFPRTVGTFETDIREGYCVWQTGKAAHERHEQLKMGCAIGTLNIDTFGTLGGFLEHDKHGVCALTCAHVVLTENEMLNPLAFCTKICVQPKTNDIRDEFGSVENGMFILRSGNEDECGIDAALIKIKTERLPVDGYFPDCKHDDLEAAELGIDLKNLVYTSGNTFKIGRDNFEQCRKNPIVKYGAETSLRRGYLKNRRMSFMPNEVTYNNGPDIIYSNQIQIYHRRKYKPFADHGDSGALVFMVTDDGLVSIGLLMAVANGFSVVNPIHDILEAFGCTSMSLIQFPTTDMTDSGFENGHVDN